MACGPSTWPPWSRPRVWSRCCCRRGPTRCCSTARSGFRSTAAQSTRPPRASCCCARSWPLAAHRSPRSKRTARRCSQCSSSCAPMGRCASSTWATRRLSTRTTRRRSSTSCRLSALPPTNTRRTPPLPGAAACATYLASAQQQAAAEGAAAAAVVGLRAQTRSGPSCTAPSSWSAWGCAFWTRSHRSCSTCLPRASTST